MLTSRFIASGFSNARSAFVIRINTALAGSSASNQITLPFSGRYKIVAVNATNIVDFGILQDAQTLTFPSSGIWTLNVTRVFPNPFIRVFFNNANDRLKLIEIQQWGDVQFSAFDGAFFGCANLNITAQDVPRLGSVSTMGQAFRGCTALVGNSIFNNWQTGNVSNFFAVFFGCVNFNQNLANWNMAKATTTQSMFQLSGFNQNISAWTLPLNTNYQSMFSNATAFNQNLSNWILSNSTTTLRNIFGNSAMSTANYTDTIVAFANRVFVNGAPFNVNMIDQSGRTFDTARSGGVNFANAGAARTYLTTTAGWTIAGDTLI